MLWCGWFSLAYNGLEELCSSYATRYGNVCWKYNKRLQNPFFFFRGDKCEKSKVNWLHGVPTERHSSRLIPSSGGLRHFSQLRAATISHIHKNGNKCKYKNTTIPRHKQNTNTYKYVWKYAACKVKSWNRHIFSVNIQKSLHSLSFPIIIIQRRPKAFCIFRHCRLEK